VQAGLLPWLKLHAALSSDDGAQIAEAAAAALSDTERLLPELVPYAVAAHMAGLLLSGDAQGALRSFHKHRRELAGGGDTWEPVFRFLVGQTFGG
jgi:hypothetical protein